eukprot:scaffold204173_cov19-Prasinocladus_malaysianus.AAC.2
MHVVLLPPGAIYMLRSYRVTLKTPAHNGIEFEGVRAAAGLRLLLAYAQTRCRAQLLLFATCGV